jgi:molybdopterin/thiamine biosynthesis adenylyltransferase
MSESYISIEIWDATGNKREIVEVPGDQPINRLIVLLVEKLNFPQFDASGSQLLSYKLHHQQSRKQLIDSSTLFQSDVHEGDVLRLVAEIVAGATESNGFGVAVATQATAVMESRFERFKLINWWDQKKLSEAKVLVIGTGALGNEILKNLALLGIGNIFIADLDLVEHSNLSRSVLFREYDNGVSKSQVAAKAVQGIYPGIKVQWFHGDIIYDLGLGVYDWADLVIAGLDNREARLAINRSCWKTNTPWIDGAIENLDGHARVFIPPDGVCYECTMSDTDWKIIKNRITCRGLTVDEMLEGKTPTTPTSASIIAAIQCQESVKLLHGIEVLKSRGIHYNGITCDTYIVDYQIKPDCYSHETYSNIHKTGLNSITNTLNDLLMQVRKVLGNDAVLEFGRFNSDIVEAFLCNHCQIRTEFFKPLGQTREKDALCPVCGAQRIPQIFHSVNGNEWFLHKTLSEAGLPKFDIVVGRKRAEEAYFLIDGDAGSVMGNLNNH